MKVLVNKQFEERKSKMAETKVAVQDMIDQIGAEIERTQAITEKLLEKLAWVAVPIVVSECEEECDEKTGSNTPRHSGLLVQLVQMRKEIESIRYKLESIMSRLEV